MQKKSSTLKNIFGVVLSNCSTILSGLIVGFLVPKILSVEGYGWYKTFTLYVTYIGLFHFGIADGIVLDYGGLDYPQLDRPLFRTYFKWFLTIQLALFAIVSLVSLTIYDADYKFILIAWGLNMVATNFTSYYQQISQITQRFKEYSARKIIQSSFNILTVLVMFLLYVNNYTVIYQYYVLAIVCINLLLTVWYIYTYKEISLGKSLSMGKTLNNILHLVKIGFPLLFANLCSTLILALDRQFVSALFDTTTYAVYAFAYSMLSLVTVATSAVGTVLYPTLKRTTSETMKDNFSSLISGVLIFVFAAAVVYYPLQIFINWFLPKYNESLPIFRIILPGLAISSAITVVIHNYYKVIGQNFLFFKKSILILILSAVANGIAYILFRTPAAISIASIITIIIWYLTVEQYFVKTYTYKRYRNLLYIILMATIFYLTSGVKLWYIGLLLYFCAFMICTFLVFKNTLKEIIHRLVR